MIKKDLVIIGGGSAGMAAAIGAYDQGVRDLLILEREPYLGGILNQCIHTGFGLTAFKEELTGPEFAQRLIDGVVSRGLPFKTGTSVISISKKRVISCSNRIDGAFEIEAKAIIMAAGCYERTAGSIGLTGDRPAGIFTAGQAQRYLNQYGYLVGKRIFILGSGDIGLIMARRFTLEGAKVLGMAEIRPWSNGLNRNLVQCLYDFGIPLYLSHTVTETLGRSRLEKIILSEVDEKGHPIKGTERPIEADTLVLSVGLSPNNELLAKLGIPLSKTKGALVNEKFETSIDGIFSCGNVLHVHDLADNVVAEAEKTGSAAAEFLQGGLNRSDKHIDVVAGEGISYVVPGKIEIESDSAPIALKFRSAKPFRDVNIEISFNKSIIKKVFKQAILPSEMETQFLTRNLLKNNQGTLVVSLKPREA
jgi:NADPH-dependent 2,4-dienoyl-CoA reductase/sulfur reductase-like enzyme